MMLRWHPQNETWRELRTLQRHLDDVFRSFPSGRPPVSGPAFNVKDTGGSYVITAELPGFRNEDLNIEATANSITVRGKRKVETLANHSVHRQERGTLEFARAFTFEGKVDLEQVQASLQHGLLRLELSKQPEAQPRQIAIKA